MNSHEVMLNALKKDFYSHHNFSQGYLKFVSFGSQGCTFDVYNPDGQIINSRVFWMDFDSIPSRSAFSTVPFSELPEALRQLQTSGVLEQTAQQTPPAPPIVAHDLSKYVPLGRRSAGLG